MKLKTEAIAGITTFFTMAYIVVVNPAILSTAGTGMPFDGVLTATVLLAFSMTLLMGLYAKLPFAVAPGMGLNAFFAFTLVLEKQIPWPTALGMVFWGGVVFLILSVLPIRTAIAKSIPHHLRHASAVGIGLFLTFIGLKNLGLVVESPATFVKLGMITPKVLCGLLGLVLMVILLKRKSPFAFLVGMGVVTVIAAISGWITTPESFVRPPDFQSVFFKLDLWGALKLSLLPSIIAICFTDLFDSISTFVGISQATGLFDEKGDPKNLKEGLLVDAFATLGAGLLGTSSGTAYIESSAGIEVGGRTGWTAVFCALCFLPCLFLSPLAAMVPMYATGPVLILVGAMMFRSASALELARMEDLIPSFLTIALIPFTFSITQGILWGFIAHTALYVLARRQREITPLTYGISLVSIFLLWLEYS